MKFLIEEVKDPIRLTSHQEKILATIIESGDSVADDIIGSDINLSGALKQLIKMKMVYNKEQDRYAVTDLGMEYAENSGIVDDVKELTDDGEEKILGKKEVAESVGSFKNYLNNI